MRSVKTAEKIINGGKSAISVKYGIEQTNHLFFTITGTKGAKVARGQRYDDPLIINGSKFNITTAGCIHDEILKHFPQFADLVKLHLSDVNGVPMYAVDNGWHIYCEQGINAAAKYLRLNDEHKAELYAALESAEVAHITFAKFVERMKPIWKKEADAVRERHGF